MKQMNNEHIVKYEQSFIKKEQITIVMEYYVNGDLDQHIKQLKAKGKRLSEESIWRFVT
jgi:serine/threonine protein kinase